VVPPRSSETHSLPEVAWNGPPQTVTALSGNESALRGQVPSTAGPEQPCGNSGGPPSKAKYSWPPIVHQYREGKVKSTPGGE
jgi:hypothetical protein